jgi:excisionase family DNA binding protein
LEFAIGQRSDPARTGVAEISERQRIASKDANTIMTTKDVAKALGVELRTVQRWVRRGSLPAIKLPGGRGEFRFEPAEIEKWKRRRTSGKLPTPFREWYSS